MNTSIAVLLTIIKVFLESYFLILVFFCAIGVSVFLYYHWRGLNAGDSSTAGLMTIFLITGLIIFYVGAIFVTDSNSLVITNSSTSNPQSANDIVSVGWGLVGFGVAIISISFSYLGNIESQRSIAMIRAFLFHGRRSTRSFQESLNPKQILIISSIWLVGAAIILIYNITFNPWVAVQNIWLIIVPTLIAYSMLLIGFSCMALALYTDYRNQGPIVKRMYADLKWIRRQIIIHCIFCYLFPARFPEIYDN